MLLTPRARVSLLLPFALAAPISAQQLIGYVNTRDANVTGATDVLDGHFVLTGSVSVTAKDHTAPITLSRGGTVSVCQTSVVHLTESREMTVAAPLLFSLDRGAVEIQMNAAASDAIMTPDLRFTVRNAGPLDLRLRVARNGDTCVENRGPGAPTLAVSDPFGESMYEVPAGRHVLFEHGSLHEVVDHETTPCGCPDEKGMSVADALLNAAVATPPRSPRRLPLPRNQDRRTGGCSSSHRPPQSSSRPPQPTAAVTPHAVPPPPVATPPAAPVRTVVTPPAPVAAQTPVVVVAPPAAAPAAQPLFLPRAPKRYRLLPPPPAAVIVQTPAPAPVPSPAPPAPAPTGTRAAAVVIVQAPAPVVTPPVLTPAAPSPEPLAPTEQSVQQAAAVAAARAAALHPFPAAVSEGLAPVPEAMPAAPGNAPAQISDTLSYAAPATSPPARPLPVMPRPHRRRRQKDPHRQDISATGQATTDPAQSAPPHDLIHLIGNFFRKLFGRG